MDTVDYLGHIICERRLELASLTTKTIRTFLSDTVDNLGHEIRLMRLELALHTTDASCGLQSRTTFTELRSFFGKSKVFQRLFSNYTLVAALLNQRFKKDKPTLYSPLDSNELHAMETIKNDLIFPPILVLSYSGEHMTSYINACNVQIGCVLPQPQKRLNDATNQ